jgi:3-phenylpropionate/trans-cinnamate dioxygenase ferredoxin component
MNDVTFIPVASAAELTAGAVKVVEIGGTSILVCHSNGRFFAVENRCSHAEEPLACGRIKAGWIACPVHGARFNLETGNALNPPAKDPIRTYPLRCDGDLIEIAV